MVNVVRTAPRTATHDVVQVVATSAPTPTTHPTSSIRPFKTPHPATGAGGHTDPTDPTRPANHTHARRYENGPYDRRSQASRLASGLNGEPPLYQPGAFHISKCRWQPLAAPVSPT